MSLSLLGLGQRYRAGTLGMAEAVQGCLDQEARTRHLNAYLEVFADQAIRQAHAYQTLLDSGCDLGPLQGVPIAIKGNIDILGQPMTAGSQILADHCATRDAEVVRRLRRAGAIVIGSTNLHEFAWGGTTDNPHYGTCRNPWDPNRVPSGSSGGSGVAVAVRSALAALGTDTGGSVRLPAAMNGITGLRPTVGAISTEGVFPLAWSMDTVGPMAASSEDCALLFAALSQTPGDPLAQLARPVDRLRLGYLDDYSFNGLQPAIEQALRGTVQAFEAMGISVEAVRLDDLESAVDAQVIVDAAEPSAIHLPWLEQQPERYGADVRVLLQAGLAFSAVDYLQAQRWRTRLRQQLDRAFQRVDVIISPTVPFTAPLIGQDEVEIAGRLESTLTGNMRYTCIPSLAALPAISFPMGLDPLGLPMGCQLLAPAGKEYRLLRLAHHFQQGSAYHGLLPPLAG